MDFLSIRKKARERAEAEARRQAGGPPAVPPPPAGPAAPGAIEELLRQEGSQASPPAPPPAPAPPAASPPATPAVAAPPADPLEEFFWREDEAAPPVPDLGGAAPEAGADAPGQALQEYVTFLLSGEEYGLPIGRVREIVKPPPIAEVPRSPPQVLGVVTLRGEVVPVFDPRLRLSLPRQAPGARARIVVCESVRGPAGLLVDAVSHVVRLPPAAVEKRPAGLGAGGAEAIAGIGREDGRLVILLDLDLLLGLAGPAAEAP